MRRISAIALVLFTGCGMGALQRARPVGDGKWQVSTGAATGARFHAAGEHGQPQNDLFVSAHVGLRRGFGEHVELLAEIGAPISAAATAGRAELGARWVPWVTDSFAGGLELRLGGLWQGPAFYGAARLAAPLGVMFEGGGELVLTPTLICAVGAVPVAGGGAQLAWIHPIVAGISVGAHLSSELVVTHLAPFAVSAGVGFVFGDPFAR